MDDEPSVRLVLRTALERAGYRVLPASNGREAIDVYQAQPAGSIAAVLIDMMMPVMGGVPAIQELVKINPNVRIIAASGIPDNEATAKAAGRQVRQFLGKPFSTDKLLRAVGTSREPGKSDGAAHRRPRRSLTRCDGVRQPTCGK